MAIIIYGKIPVAVLIDDDKIDQLSEATPKAMSERIVGEKEFELSEALTKAFSKALGTDMVQVLIVPGAILPESEEGVQQGILKFVCDYFDRVS